MFNIVFQIVRPQQADGQKDPNLGVAKSVDAVYVKGIIENVWYPADTPLASTVQTLWPWMNFNPVVYSKAWGKDTCTFGLSLCDYP